MIKAKQMNKSLATSATVVSNFYAVLVCTAPNGIH